MRSATPDDFLGAISAHVPPLGHVARAGLETAFMDAGGAARAPLYEARAGPGVTATELHTDITLPISVQTVKAGILGAVGGVAG